MGASSLIFLDNLTHLADGDHIGGVVEVLNRLHRVATLHQFGPCREEGPAGLRGQLVRRRLGGDLPARTRSARGSRRRTGKPSAIIGSARGWR